MDRKADSASALSALDITDSRAFLSGVSDAEQACLSGEIDPGRLMLLVGTPELTKEEERAILIGCLEHETLLRLVLTPVLDQARAAERRVLRVHSRRLCGRGLGRPDDGRRGPGPMRIPRPRWSAR